MAFDAPAPGGRWRLPLAVFELENQRSDHRVAYSLWKVLCLRVDLRVVFAFRRDWDESPNSVDAVCRDVVGNLSPLERMSLAGETVLAFGNRGDGETFPWGYFSNGGCSTPISDVLTRCERQVFGASAMKVVPLALVALTVLWCAPSHATEVTVSLQSGHAGFDGAADVSVSVDSRIAERNLGGTPSLDIWQHGGVAFLRFDLSKIPRTAQIETATLELFAMSCGFSEKEIARRWPVGVYECIQPWVEGTGRPMEEKRDGATLSTSDGSTLWKAGKPTGVAGAPLGSAAVAGAPNWIKWNLKPSIVQQWITHPEKNYGVVIWGKPPGKAVSFASCESSEAGHRPVLRLTLLVPDAEVAAVKATFGSSVPAQGDEKPGPVWLVEGGQYKITKSIIAASSEKYVEDLRKTFNAKDTEGGLEMVRRGQARRLDEGTLLVLAIHDKGILDRVLGSDWYVECRYLVNGKSGGKVYIFGPYFRDDFMEVESTPKLFE